MLNDFSFSIIISMSDVEDRLIGLSILQHIQEKNPLVQKFLPPGLSNPELISKIPYTTFRIVHVSWEKVS